MLHLPLLTAVPQVMSRFNHLYILPCLSGVMYISKGHWQSHWSKH